MIKITEIGWFGVGVGMAVSILACLMLPLDFAYGALAYLGATIAILFAIYNHEHVD